MCIESEIRYRLRLSLGFLELTNEFFKKIDEGLAADKLVTWGVEDQGIFALDEFEKEFRTWFDTDTAKGYIMGLREPVGELITMGKEKFDGVLGSDSLIGWSLSIDSIRIKTPSMRKENLRYFHCLLQGVCLYARKKNLDIPKSVSDTLLGELEDLDKKINNVTNMKIFKG